MIAVLMFVDGLMSYMMSSGAENNIIYESLRFYLPFNLFYSSYLLTLASQPLG